MTSYHEPGAQIIIVLRAVRVISRGVRGKVNFGTACVFSGCGGFRCRQVYGMEPVLAGGAEMTAGSGFLATGAGTASTWPDGGLVGHYTATTWPLADEEASSWRGFRLWSISRRPSRRGRLDLLWASIEVNQALNCTLVLQLGSPSGRAALGVGCRGGRQCHAACPWLLPGGMPAGLGAGSVPRAATVAGLGRRVEPGLAGRRAVKPVTSTEWPACIFVLGKGV